MNVKPPIASVGHLISAATLLSNLWFTIGNVRRHLLNQRNNRFRLYLDDHPEVPLRPMPRDTAFHGEDASKPATRRESAGGSCPSASSFAQADTGKFGRHPPEVRSDATTLLSRMLLGLGLPYNGGQIPDRHQARLRFGLSMGSAGPLFHMVGLGLRHLRRAGKFSVELKRACPVYGQT
jgi:hypothetical protein